MKKVWITALAIAILLGAYLYTSRPSKELRGDEATITNSAPLQTSVLRPARPKSQFEIPPGFTPPPRDFSYLPETKHAAVIKAEQEHAEKFRRRTTAGKQDAAGIAELKWLQGELDQRLSQILTAKEKFEYDLRNSVIAQSLRTSLHPMEPTDVEFRAIYKHRDKFEQRAAENPSDIDIAWKECDAGIRTGIGDDRFKRYQLTNDKDFRAIYHFFLKERVEPEIVDKLYNVWAKAGVRGDAIRLDKAISAESKQQQLKELTENCMDEMEKILGTGPGSEKLNARRANLASTMESIKPRTTRRPPELLGLQPGFVLMPTAP